MDIEKNHGNSVQALKLLQKTSGAVTEMLSQMSANDAGYLAIADILTQIQNDIQDAQDRANLETIRLGILGGRGSGKSTLANAIIGDDILPESAIVFCTSIPTAIKYEGRYHLSVSSNIEANRIEEVTDLTSFIKSALEGICKESENPDNAKQITRISLGVPNVILDGKEIVDVPGFTKGNALHQAFAERYAKYYCDICLVLINNSESVEVNGEGGLTALCSAFKGRLESTAFILNKADQSSKNDLVYIADKLRKTLDSSRVTLFTVSSKNVLMRSGDRYEFDNLFRYIAYLSGRKLAVLVRGLLERLSVNFLALTDLCRLNADLLAEVGEDLKRLATTEFKTAEMALRRAIAKEAAIPKELAPLDLTKFDLPHHLGALGPYDYAKQMLDSLGSIGTSMLAEHAQNQQALIFRLFSARFDEQVRVFDNEIRTKLQSFEAKFGIRAAINTPSVTRTFTLSVFKPDRIERLKPNVFRLWVEENLPGYLGREIVFWKSPITLRIPFGVDITFSLPLFPKGFKNKTEALEDTAKRVPAQAIEIMNEYLLDSISLFIREMSQEYERALSEYLSEWARCLRDYDKRVQLAKTLTEPGSLAKLDSIARTLDHLLAEAGTLALPESGFSNNQI
jgi:hypothetical protein